MPNSEDRLGAKPSAARRFPGRSFHDPKRSVRIVIADANPMSRSGLRALLQTERSFQVVGEAATSQAALEQVRDFQPDVLLLDMSVSQMDGIEILRQIAAAGLPVRVLVLIADIATNQAVQALNLGAGGIVSKSSPTSMLFEGIHRIVAGGYWLSPDCVASLVERLRRTPPRMTPREAKFGLTARELEVIMEVVAGSSNSEIAGKLSLSEQTVKHHLTHVFDKLGVYSRVELALFAVNHNLCGTDKHAPE